MCYFPRSCLNRQHNDFDIPDLTTQWPLHCLIPPSVILFNFFLFLSLFYIIQSDRPSISSIQLAKDIHIHPVISIMSSTFSLTSNSMAAKKGRSINPIFFRAQEFETQELNIVDYTKCLLSQNEPQGIHLSQDDVNRLFEANVRTSFDPEDPKCQFLLQQKLCPLIMDFWEKYKEPGKFLSRKSKEARTSFRALPRDTQNQKKGSLILGDGITKVLIPDIDLLSLQNLSYLEVVSKVYHVNESDHRLETNMGRIWVGIVSNVFHFEVESMKVAKIAEAIKHVENSWKMVSDYRLSLLRQQRVRPVAADFFDDYPNRAYEQDSRIPSTVSQWPMQANEPHTTMVDMEPGLEIEEQQYAGIFTNTQESPSQLSVFGPQPRHTNNRSSFNSGPAAGSNSRFCKTFGPAIPVDANGTIMNTSHRSQAYDVQPSNEHSKPSAPYQNESLNDIETQARFHEPVLTNQIHPAAEGHGLGAAALPLNLLARDPLLPSVRSMQQYLSLQPPSSLPIRPRHTSTQTNSNDRNLQRHVHTRNP